MVVVLLLVSWLDGIERDAGYRLAELRMQSAEAPGQVSADILLEAVE